MKLIQRALKLEIGGGNVRLWPFLAAVSLAFAWLQPHHYNPWPGFHTNAVVAVWVLVAMVLVVAARVRPVEWPPITFVIGMMVCGVWLQHLAGFIVHSADAVFTSMHLLGCALIFVTVRALHTHNHLEKLGDIVFGALVVAGIGTVASALYQSVGIVPSDEFAGLGIWIMSLPDGVRAAGNVAQPNQMATMLVWASIGGLWAAYRGVIRWPILVLLSCYLALGMGISQSRVGLLEMFCLTIALAVWRQKMGGWAAFGAIALAMLVQAIVFFFLPAITQALLLDYDGRLLSQVINNTARLDIYEHVLFAISKQPWLGYGMTTLAPAQWVAGDELQGLHAYFHASHNLVLDILAWWGVPIGGLLIGLLIWWVWKIIHSINSTQYALFGCALGVFALHTMVELPHWNAAYLYPATIFAAALDCSVRYKRILLARFSAFVSILVFSALMLGMTIWDYVRLETSYVLLRAEERGLIQVTEVPHTIVLTHLADYMRMARMIARPNVSSETIAWMEQTVHGIPNYNAQVTHAVTLALNGRKPEALKWMRRLNSVSPKHYHADYLRVWSYFQSQHPHLIGDMQWPPLEQSN